MGVEEVHNEERGEKKETVFERVKERLSMRSKKEKEVKDHPREIDVEKEPLIENEQMKENADDIKEETGEKKKENIFRRIIRRLSFRSKKKKEKVVVTSIDEVDEKEASHADEDLEKQIDTTSLSETSIANDLEVSALCGDENEENKISPPIPIINISRPPLPTIRRPPCSATTAQSRPVSQLDAALKQFKLSTAASRENLRSSRVDISQVEEQVKAMVTSRPSTPTPAGWRSRAPAENSNLMDQWNKLSASMTDLR